MLLSLQSHCEHGSLIIGVNASSTIIILIISVFVKRHKVVTSDT